MAKTCAHPEAEKNDAPTVQSARYIFFNYSPSGYLDEKFYSSNESLIARIDCSKILSQLFRLNCQAF